MKANKKSDERKAFIALKEKISIIRKDEFESNAFCEFDLESWMDSRIQGRPFC